MFQPQPREVIEKAKMLWSSGSSVVTIADILAKDGVKSMKSGTPCSPAMVANWLKKEPDVDWSQTPLAAAATPALKRAYTKKAEPEPSVDLKAEDHILTAIASFIASKMPTAMKIKMIRTVIDAFD